MVMAGWSGGGGLGDTKILGESLLHGPSQSLATMNESKTLKQLCKRF